MVDSYPSEPGVTLAFMTSYHHKKGVNLGSLVTPIFLLHLPYTGQGSWQLAACVE